MALRTHASIEHIQTACWVFLLAHHGGENARQSVAHRFATKTQREAIEWAKKNGHIAHVARVRHLNDKKKAGHWRALRAYAGRRGRLMDFP